MRSFLPKRLIGVMGVALLLAAATPSNSPVADAAMRGDAATIRALLAQGADVNAAQGDGMTALHWASLNGDQETVQLLLTSGAQANRVTRLGAYSALHLASENGHAGVVGALVGAGADAKLRTTTGGVTALHLAARAGSREAVEAILSAGVDVNSREDYWGQTPLMFAASRDRADVIRALVARGADLSVTSSVVDLPAAQAVDRQAARRRTQVLEEFRRAAGSPVGWRPTAEQVQEAVRAAQEVQATSIASVSEEAPEQVQVAGEEVAGFSGQVGTQGGLTALLHAVREGYVESTLALLEAGADINQVSAGDRTSPILSATINGHFDLALILLERGADPNIVNSSGASPLFAVINGQWAPRSRYPQQHAHFEQDHSYLETMEKLLQAGADPNLRLTRHLWFMSYTFDLLSVDTRGATPFWRAAYATDVEAMKLLVKHGADPGIATLKGAERRRRGGAVEDPSGLDPIPEGGPAVFPIHAATGVGYGEGFAGNAHRHVPEGWLPAVRYLVEELGADVNARDHNGYSPVHHAAARGDNRVIEYLVSKGADPTLVARTGQTTVDMANGPVERISPFPATIALLESMGAKNNNRCLSC